MQVDLANPPPPPSQSSSGQGPARPQLGPRQSTRRTPADRAKRKLDQKAADINASFDIEEDLVVFERVSLAGWVLAVGVGRRAHLGEGGPVGSDSNSISCRGLTI